MANKLDVAVSIRSGAWRTALPEAAALCRRAARAALAARRAELGPGAMEVSIVLADDDMVRGLNRSYRDRDEATNVLSFPALEGAALASPGPRPDGAPVMLGDVAVAFETARTEALAEDKPLAHHLVHLVVHGVLHLLGYDHHDPVAAEIMEKLEAEVLAGLGVPDPYAPRPRAAS